MPPPAESGIFLSPLTESLPRPPVFRHGFNGQPFTVPRYFPYQHAETQWMIAAIRDSCDDTFSKVRGTNGGWERLERVAALNPSHIRRSYFQIPDKPASGRSMVSHGRAVLYTTTLGLAIYLHRPVIVANLLGYRLASGKPLIRPDQPCFLANVYAPVDLLQLPPCCLVVLRESYDSTRPLIKQGGWSPLSPICMLYRRPYKICRMQFQDLVEYGLAQLVSRPGLRLPRLMHELIASLDERFSLLHYEEVQVPRRGGSPDCLIEEWVSVPRRLLRFGFYYDRELRLITQIVGCIHIFQKASFFQGPTRSCLEIVPAMRVTCLDSNFKDCGGGQQDEVRAVMDQDGCISLVLALTEHAHQLRHEPARDRLLTLLPSLLLHTHWLPLLLVLPARCLARYFSRLTDRVGMLPETVIVQARASALSQLREGIIPLHAVTELSLRPHETISVNEALHRLSCLLRSAPTDCSSGGSSPICSAQLSSFKPHQVSTAAFSSPSSLEDAPCYNFGDAPIPRFHCVDSPIPKSHVGDAPIPKTYCPNAPTTKSICEDIRNPRIHRTHCSDVSYKKNMQENVRISKSIYKGLPMKNNTSCDASKCKPLSKGATVCRDFSPSPLPCGPRRPVTDKTGLPRVVVTNTNQNDEIHCLKESVLTLLRQGCQ